MFDQTPRVALILWPTHQTPCEHPAVVPEAVTLAQLPDAVSMGAIVIARDDDVLEPPVSPWANRPRVNWLERARKEGL